MSTTAIQIDPPNGGLLPGRNLTDTLVLITVLTLMTGLAAFLLLGWEGLIAAVLGVGLIAFAAPHIPPLAILRLYRATPIDARNGRDLYRVLHELTARSGMHRVPTLYVVPSLTMNAFSTGTPETAVIAVTEGLLRKLSLRQIAGVLGHELSHIRNNDLRLLVLADALSRGAQVLSWVGLGLVLFYVPQYIAGHSRIPWVGIALLYLAPAASTFLQLGLSRTREHQADADSVQLTGDPAGLASALHLIGHEEGRFWDDLIFPNTRRTPNPSVLRSHPDKVGRIARLRDMAPPAGQTAIAFGLDAPRISLVGVGPVAMRPRYRIPGVWF